jgi:predicted Zn finger-like uncharacterized protein
MIITCPNCSTRYSLPQDKVKPGGQKVRCAKCGTVWFQPPDEPEPLDLTAEEAIPTPPSPAWAAPTPAGTETTPPPSEPPPPEPPVAPMPAAPTATEAAPRPPTADDFASFHVAASSEDAASGAGRKIALAVILVVVLALAALVVFKQQVQDLTGIQLISSHAPEPAATPAPEPAPATPAPPAEPPAPPPLTLTFDEVESSIEEIDGIRRLQVKGLIVNPADHEQAVPGLAFNMLDKDGNAIDRWAFAAPVKALAPHTTTRFAAQRDLPPTALQELVPGFDLPENAPLAITAPASPDTAAKPQGTPASGGAPAAKPPAPTKP